MEAELGWEWFTVHTCSFPDSSMASQAKPVQFWTSSHKTSQDNGAVQWNKLIQTPNSSISLNRWSGILWNAQCVTVHVPPFLSESLNHDYCKGIHLEIFTYMLFYCSFACYLACYSYVLLPFELVYFSGLQEKPM